MSTAAIPAVLLRSSGGPLERAERLEQLRALENGFKIRVVKPTAIPWASIRPRIGREFRRFSRKQQFSNHGQIYFCDGRRGFFLGKGIAAASIGCLLESRGLKVTLQKFDPYLNVDPGTMSPFQHGEVFVTDDGAETDLDLGHYERFTHAPLTQANNLTSGRIYEQIISASAAATIWAKPCR